jgi:hypothetical protein
MASFFWRGVEWTAFWLIFGTLFVGAVLYVILPVQYPELFMTGVPRQFREAAPVEEINDYMSEISQGYTLEHTQNLERDPNMRNQLLITYVISSLDGSQSWTYTWGWKVPMEALFRPERGEIGSLIRQCELVPLTDAARVVNESLLTHLSETFWNNQAAGRSTWIPPFRPGEFPFASQR